MVDDITSREQLYLALRGKPDLKDFEEKVLTDPGIIPVLLEIIRTDSGSTKFYCEKVIRFISESQPLLLYPFFDDVAALLDSPNNFIRWGSIITLSNLASIDKENKFAVVYEKYFSLLQSDSMITASNVTRNAWKFIAANPSLEGDITARLLRITENTYYDKGQPSPECKNILYGHMLYCFEQYFASSSNKEKILAFAAVQTDNTRKAIAKSAEAFLRKFGDLF